MAIQNVIKRRGFTLEQLGVELGKRRPQADGTVKPISRSAVHQIVNGNPTFNNLKDIADIIGVSLSELVSDSTDLTAMVDYNGKLYKATTTAELRRIADEIDACGAQ